MSKTQSPLLSPNMRYVWAIVFLLLLPILLALITSYGSYNGSCSGQAAESYPCGFGQHFSIHMFPYDVFSWVFISWTLAFWIKRVSSEKLTQTALPAFVSWLVSMALALLALLVGFVAASTIHTRLLPAALDLL